jgi:hypothetical protein
MGCEICSIELDFATADAGGLTGMNADGIIDGNYGRAIILG